ncbi:hypothetical protein PRZ48_013430 [Zasmidium cellare]|uniref:Uncharacterized protein n=1 Tax=Zasmidium cellare TaxID=395010 RepID=A0ABR0E1S6_ZASCE|nr:hypothetical protein PRZ48_013430 [Zasmidium cellare]
MAGKPALRPMTQRKTRGQSARDAMDKARSQLINTSTQPTEDDPSQAATPLNASTPTKSKQKSTPSSTPKSKKRKSRTAGYGDESDSDYRAHTSSRKSSRRTRRASFESDPDGDYGGSMTPTRKMTRPVLSRHSYRKLISAANGEEDVDEEDEREDLCLEKCPFYENEAMIECDRIECGRKFHLGLQTIEADGRTKHIDTRFHYIRQRIAAGKINVEWAPTERHLTDGLTKALDRYKYERVVQQLGLIE